VAARRRSAGRGASRGQKGSPGWLWLLAGILIGLGLAWYLFGKGYIPQPRQDVVTEPPAAETGKPAASEEVAPRGKDSQRQKYDFFTVLPEMEVVVPEQELQRQSQAQQAREATRTESGEAPPNAAPDSGDRYVLQAGSFRQSADAEQRKARLALLGLSTRVQTVTVNGATWHRVLVGPVNGAARADQVRRQLADNGIDSMVTKSP
jgi:cell division protein FtsN